jgi:hypothetical protein
MLGYISEEEKIIAKKLRAHLKNWIKKN